MRKRILTLVVYKSVPGIKNNQCRSLEMVLGFSCSGTARRPGGWVTGSEDELYIRRSEKN